MSLPPYDPEAKCPKCGHDVVSTVYCTSTPYGHVQTLNYPGEVCIEKVEHHHRRCQRCSYAWVEDVVPSNSLT